MPARSTVVVTRPLPEALHWQQQLQDAGLTAAVLPLIDIAPAQDAATLAALEIIRTQLPRYRALMFVSPNAVRSFVSTQGMGHALVHAIETAGTRCWSPGPGTRSSLLQAGVPAHAIDSPPPDAAQFDSESLWVVVAPSVQAQDRILIVRGASQQAAPSLQGSGREWLAEQLQAAGAQLEWLGVYTRQCPTATPAFFAALAQHLTHSSVWLFSSSEAIAHLQQLSPNTDWSGQRALTTHPRIAQAARSAGFGDVRECKPELKAVRASIESWA